LLEPGPRPKPRPAFRGNKDTHAEAGTTPIMAKRPQNTMSDVENPAAKKRGAKKLADKVEQSGQSSQVSTNVRRGTRQRTAAKI
jgi:hypothetical protein